MKMELPEKFTYNSKGRGNYAYVKNGVLFVHGTISWEKLAYALTYSVKGIGKCSYCGKKLRKGKVTLDHMFPRNFGGVSITNNLEPCCSKCNSIKSDLNLYQYQIFRTMSSSAKSRFKKSVYRKNEQIRYSRGFDLPRKWITKKRIEDIIVRFPPMDIETQKKYLKVEAFINQYGNVPSPVVVSSNNVLLKNLNVLCVANKRGFTTIPAIVLDNVVVEL